MPGLTSGEQPDPAGLPARLDAADPGLRREITRRAGQPPWPVPVPADLLAGIGRAQFAAALRAAADELGLGQGARTVGADRTLTAEERRLVADRPPHHGS